MTGAATARRHVRTETLDVVREHRRAKREDQIVAVETLDDLFADRGQEPRKEAMPLGKAAARRHRTHPHERLMPLGERHHLIPRAVSIDAGAHHEHGTLAAIEPCRDGVDERRIGEAPSADGARRDQLARALPVVNRNRDERRPARLLHRHVVGARDGGWHVLAARRLAAPLHVGLRQGGGIGGREERLVREARSGLLASRDDERRAVAVDREDIAHRVADAGRRMQVDDRRVAGGLGEAVRHADDDRFLQPEHVAEVGGEVLEERQLGGAGITEDRGHPQLAQQAGDGVANGSHSGAHYGSEPSSAWPPTRTGYGGQTAARDTVAAVRRFLLSCCLLCALTIALAQSRPPRTWSAYLGGADSSQFTALDQITASNVSRLEVAWRFPVGQRSFMFGPLMADGLVFVLAGANDLVALDAATGAKVWTRPHPGAVGTRGLNYWRSADGRDRRLLYIAGGLLTAVDARTGEPVTDVRQQRPCGPANGSRGHGPIDRRV